MFSLKIRHYFQFVSAKHENIQVHFPFCAGDKVLFGLKNLIKEKFPAGREA